MSCSKADSRYTRRYGDCDAQSCGTSDEEDVPPITLRTRVEWKQHYTEEIELLYDAYREVGSHLFGPAFHQLGDVNDLANFIFKYMQPGATKFS